MQMKVKCMNWLSVRVPLTESYLNSLEKELNITLPEDYKAQIGPVNGGALRNAYIELPRLGKVPYSRNVALHKCAQAGIYDLFPIFNCVDGALFPFASVGNGDYFCFDLVSETVVLYLHEIQSTYNVCKTFTELMNRVISE